MKTQTEYVDHWKRVIETEWFQHHKANGPNGIIYWSEPGNSLYACRFIIHNCWLIVVGDLGEAVYQFGQAINLDFLAGLNFNYFHDKCEASEKGKSPMDWDGSVAWHGLSELLKSGVAEDDPADNLAPEVVTLLRGLSEDSCASDYQEAATEAYDLECDGELSLSISTLGDVPMMRCVAHYVGIQMAIKQLKIQ